MDESDDERDLFTRDDGQPYAPGDIVRLRGVPNAYPEYQLTKDPSGDHEVLACRPAAGLRATLRVRLRKIR